MGLLPPVENTKAYGNRSTLMTYRYISIRLFSLEKDLRHATTVTGIHANKTIYGHILSGSNEDTYSMKLPFLRDWQNHRL